MLTDRALDIMRCVAIEKSQNVVSSSNSVRPSVRTFVCHVTRVSRLVTVGDRSLAEAGPRLCNSLHDDVASASSVNICLKLKTIISAHCILIYLAYSSRCSYFSLGHLKKLGGFVIFWIFFISFT